MSEFDLGRAVGRVDIDTSGVTRAQATMSSFSGSMRKSLGSVSKSMVSSGKTMTKFVTLPLLGIAVAAGKTVLEFQRTMNTMEAVAGVPAPALEKLKDLAVELGAQTVFSANEAAAAMLELAKAGVKTSDIMGGALANTLDLATAGDLELAEAATIAANAMNVFGLSGKESKIAVDALAGAANASSADVRGIAEALAQGGLAANAAGLSIEETTAVLGLFAQKGLKGSDAGTSLKTMLLSLVPSTLRAREAMSDLGISFVDNEGNIKSLSSIADILQDKIGGLTQAEQQLALKTIFGTDAFRASLILTEAGAKGLEKYTDATTKSGNAADVAAGKMKGLPGIIETLKGAWETFLLTVGDKLVPLIEKTAKFITDLIGKFLDLDPALQETIIKFAALAAVIGPLLVVFGKLIGFGVSVYSAVAKIGVAIAGTGTAASTAAAPVGAFGRSIGLLGKAGVAAGILLVGKFISDIATASRDGREQVQGFVDDIKEGGATAEASASAWGALGEKYEENKGLLDAYRTSLLGWITGEENSIRVTMGVKAAADAIHEANLRRFNQVTRFVAEIVPRELTAAGNEVDAFVRVRQAILDSVDVSKKHLKQVLSSIGVLDKYGVEIDANTGKMLSNLLKVGDWRAALELLAGKIRELNTGLKNSLTPQQLAAESAADLGQKYAYAAGQAERLAGAVARVGALGPISLTGPPIQGPPPFTPPDGGGSGGGGGGGGTSPQQGVRTTVQVQVDGRTLATTLARHGRFNNIVMGGRN